MLILAIETTGPLASCALWDGCAMDQTVNHTKYSHLEEIAPMIQRILKDNGKTPAELDAIAVSQGPGSFTGVRIGMATVKGIAQVWDKPVIEVPTLAAFAFGDYDWMQDGKKRLLCPIFDARRSQVYSGVYEAGNDKAVIADSACDFLELLEKIRPLMNDYDELCFFGDGTAIYKDAIDSCGMPHMTAPEKDLYQMASSAARLGGILYERGVLKDCYTCEPEYLRLAEAERKLKEKQGEK